MAVGNLTSWIEHRVASSPWNLGALAYSAAELRIDEVVAVAAALAIRAPLCHMLNVAVPVCLAKHIIRLPLDGSERALVDRTAALDAEPVLQALACTCLLWEGSETARQTLRRNASDFSWSYSASALDGLCRHQDAVMLERCRDLFDSPEESGPEWADVWAALGLSWIGDAAAREVLVRETAIDTIARVRCVAALARYSDARPLLEPLTRDRDSSVRREALLGIARHESSISARRDLFQTAWRDE